ncbi:MAG: class I SAM-dependent methyltransferase [Phycisphaerales bacterium]|nr:class I SAM-dependent methyltransferase [Phycisphaerales bacterium]
MPLPWHESDEFWTLTGPAMFTPDKLAAAEAEIDWILKETGLAAAGPGRPLPFRGLDMPCGVGRHALALARRGFEVTGVDRTAAYLEIAHSRTPPGTPVEWRLDDMRAFDGAGRYDLALNLYTSIGYFEEPAENLRVLQNLRRALRTGGKLVVDALGKEVLARVLMPTQWQDLPDGSMELREARIVDDWRRVDNRWIIITPDGRRVEHRVLHWLYDAAELRRMMELAGFGNLRCFGSLAGGAYGPSATRLVIIGEAT